MLHTECVVDTLSAHVDFIPLVFYNPLLNVHHLLSLVCDITDLCAHTCLTGSQSLSSLFEKSLTEKHYCRKALSKSTFHLQHQGDCSHIGFLFLL